MSTKIFFPTLLTFPKLYRHLFSRISASRENIFREIVFAKLTPTNNAALPSKKHGTHGGYLSWHMPHGHTVFCNCHGIQIVWVSHFLLAMETLSNCSGPNMFIYMVTSNHRSNRVAIPTKTVDMTARGIPVYIYTTTYVRMRRLWVRSGLA